MLFSFQEILSPSPRNAPGTQHESETEAALRPSSVFPVFLVLVVYIHSTKMSAEPPLEEPKPPPPAPPQSESRKRKALDAGDFHNSGYFKIRAIVKELRPFFVQLFEAPDFRNCEAACEIRRRMKVMIELTKQLRTDTPSPPKAKRQEQTCSGVKAEHYLGKLQEEQKDVQVPRASELSPHANISDEIKKSNESGKEQDGLQGTFVVGGSPIGWNFVVFPGSVPVYYGRTKASAIALQAAKQSAKESEEKE
ncbi:hypothetical protein DsansV1_C10g0099171 [Dioscorea sansibarensis]